MSLLSSGLDVLFPRRCCGCGRVAVDDFCFECRLSVEEMPLPECGCDKAAAYVYGGPVRDAILGLKHNGRVHVAAPLGGRLAEMLGPVLPVMPACVVPVPSHRLRLRQRGYNPASLLALEVARTLGVPMSERLLERRGELLSQKGKGVAQRREAIAGAFVVVGRLPPGPVLLVDDVWTTGATLDSCRQVLELAGGQVCGCWAVARVLL